ncbi:hypothetical protein S83_039020, partial [Arachis hypogaea]
NSFHAKLPKSIGNMSNLEVFDADAYSIDGEIPLKIGNLTNLYTLSVYQNDLSGIIPTTIKDMLLELARREKSTGIKPDVDLDIFMK